MHTTRSAVEKRSSTLRSSRKSKRIRTDERSKAQWSDLPIELLMHIFGYIIIVPPPPDISQHPQGIDLNLALGQIDRSSSSAFFECLSKSCTFIRLRFYKPHHNRGSDSDLQSILDKTFNCTWTKALFANITTSNPSYHGFEVSTVDIDLEQVKDCGGSATSQVVFLLDEMRGLQLCQILQDHLSDYKHMIVKCHNESKKSSEQIRKLLLDIASVVRDLESVELTAPPDIVNLTDVDKIIIKQLTTVTTITSNDMPLYQHQLAMIQSINAFGTPTHVTLPIVAEIVVRFFGKTFPKFQSSPLIPSLAMCYCSLLMKGLSDYLLCSLNTRQNQTHYLLQKNGDGYLDISRCLQHSCTNLVTDFVMDFDPSVPFYSSYSQEMFEIAFQMLQTRAQLELALARAATIYRFFPLEPAGRARNSRQWWLVHFQNGDGSSDMYLGRAFELANTIKWKADGLFLNQSDVGQLDLQNVYEWYDEFYKIGKEIEQAIVQRRTSPRKKLLVNPMPELSQFPFTIRFPSGIE